MPSIVRHAELAAPADRAWTVLDTYSRGEDRFFAMVAAVEVRDGARHVHLSEGGTMVERFVTVDPVLRRVAYTIPGFAPGVEHHSAMQILPWDAGSLLLWTTDLDGEVDCADFAPTYDAAFADLLAAVTVPADA